MRIGVAVSGGMDSLFTAVLLAEAGHEVLALHAFFLPPTDDSRAKSEELGKAVNALGCDYAAVDLSREFDEQVIAPFEQAYIQGLTPNPCAVCNRTMKFGLLADEALRQGAERIATGHYARVKGEGESTRLVRGLDPIKDQSYFLSLVPRKLLSKAVFPLGEWTKEQVKAELKLREMTPPLPSESQEICFVPDDDYCAFLSTRQTELPGPGAIILSDGTELGRHQGLWRYTLGQRRGIGVAWSEPLYVTGKNLETNALIVGPRESTLIQHCDARDVNLLVPQDQWPQDILAQLRYRQQAQPVRANLKNHGMRLDFTNPQSLPAPGQVAACYSPDGIVLAGGVII
ncbi:tRNA 2-thiouridine(34) synthase MnmA [Desulfovibrio ferrophilus]|uniref:tRNA-specific 2-thiouridylase MnmA n=1 Tax=Desulfovibrio ferrophilus TaxID=241368 RepID=A0A2Z6AVA1_9BACT|nr:tRNA 2-thiouridine(34) synthase MnmA [Desulfovibrio ferrophilus]BBD07157.1 tRNA-specific 2-thiouridylase MnmA [Desulfovibrio ferrophilus]